MFDTSNSGLVKPHDIVVAMIKGGHDKEKKSLFRLFQSLDIDEFNEIGITFRTFMEYLNKNYLGRDMEHLRYQFELLDTECKGYIEADQLIKIH